MAHRRRRGVWWTGRWFRNAPGTAVSWHEELAYRAWRPERRLREQGVLMICPGCVGGRACLRGVGGAPVAVVCARPGFGLCLTVAVL